MATAGDTAAAHGVKKEPGASPIVAYPLPEIVPMPQATVLHPLPAPLSWGLLLMRAGAALMLLLVHGLPKLLDWSGELQRIEDPLGLGARHSPWPWRCSPRCSAQCC